MNEKNHSSIMKMNAYIHPYFCFYELTYTIFILWLNSWVLCMCVGEIRHFTILSSNFRFMQQLAL